MIWNFRKGKMADIEDENKKDKENCDQARVFDIIDRNNDPDHIEERIRVDRRKLEILLQG